MPGTCGGLKRSWYGWPAARQIQRPDMRRMSSSPGTSTRTAAATRSRARRGHRPGLGLHRGPREPVEDHAVGRVGPGEPVQQQADDDLVGHELARVHVPARLDPERRAIADGGPEQVAGRDHGYPRRSASRGAWVPFPAPGRRGGRPHSRNGNRRGGGDHRMNPSYWRIRSCASSCFIVSTTTDTTISRPVPPRAMFWKSGWTRPMKRGDAATRAQEQGAGHRDPGHDPGQVVLRRATWRMPGMKPPFLRSCSAVSSGLNVNACRST
jgi:hypothetical protein